MKKIRSKKFKFPKHKHLWIEHLKLKSSVMYQCHCLAVKFIENDKRGKVIISIPGTWTITTYRK